MFIKVKVQNPGHGGKSRAKRRFENGTEYQMEVVDRDEDFFTDATRAYGDMTKCNRAAYEAFKKDPAFSVLSGDETSVGISEVVLDGVRAQAALNAAKLSDAEIQIVRLKSDLEKVTKERDEAQFKLAELEDQGAAATGGEGKAGKGKTKDDAKK